MVAFAVSDFGLLGVLESNCWRSAGRTPATRYTVFAYSIVWPSTLLPSEWIARCAERLGQRWRTVPVSELEKVAIYIWQKETLRNMEPEADAAAWPAPLGGSDDPPATMQQ